MGWVKDPKRSAKNKVYHATTLDTRKAVTGNRKRKTHSARKGQPTMVESSRGYQPRKIISSKARKGTRSQRWGFGILCFFAVGFLFGIMSDFGIGRLLLGLLCAYGAYKVRSHMSLQESEVKKVRLTHQEIQAAQMQAQRCLEIYNDSSKLFSETVNPEVFFGRFQLAKEQLETLKFIKEDTDNAIGYEGDNLDHKLTLFTDHYSEAFKDFANRYHKASVEKAEKLKTERGRKNNFNKSLEDLLEYKEHIDAADLAFVEQMWQNTTLN